ncbi:hypothetical protein L596_004193 [Steinernema carpocapsae]|uniref:Uncharacterized protein n=1 Tax=Steinernema carpocapsae TaxID=34508 RepID=A0A4U8UV50_STECR|nr:hypothetical protein L596_004193 [Steinernema carpocapsae]
MIIVCETNYFRFFRRLHFAHSFLSSPLGSESRPSTALRSFMALHLRKGDVVRWAGSCHPFPHICGLLSHHSRNPCFDGRACIPCVSTGSNSKASFMAGRATLLALCDGHRKLGGRTL